MNSIQEDEYPWYEIVEGNSLAQGDLLRNYEVAVPKALVEEGKRVPLELRTFDFVVMTQTCDIEHGKVASILLCPWWDLWNFVDAATARGENWGEKQREALLQGNLPGYHLLNETVQGDINLNIGVVDFHEIYTEPIELVRKFAESTGKRLRLLPPYREHLAQDFARFFMRVGLPVNIPKEKIKKRPTGR